jgi:MFS family permease
VGGLGVYRELLGNRNLMRLLAGEFISGIGDWLYIVAIFVVIYRESGDAALVGAFGAVRLLPYVFLSVPAGIIADRFDRRLVLLASDIYRGSLMVVMTILVATGGPTLLIAALAIAAAGGSSFFYPAMGAYLPSLARDERQLGPANSAWANVQNVSFILGPAIGGLVLAFGSVQLAFVLNALSFIVIAVILWGLPPSRAKRAPAVAPDVAAEPSAEAATEPATTKPPASRVQLRPLSGLMVIQLVHGFFGGGLQVITVILAIDVLKSGEEANGYLNAAIGVGGLIGGIVAGALVLRRRLGVPMLAGALITGVGMIVLGLATSLPVALVAIGVLSAGSLIIDIIAETLFQWLVPDELRGRGVGVLVAVTTLTGAAGAFLLPVLLTGIGPVVALGSLGVAIIAFDTLALVLLGKAAERAPTPYEATIARISTLPLFAGVPAGGLQAAMRKVTEVVVTPGQAVVRQGDPSDRFYIIASGQFRVTQMPDFGIEPVVLRELGPDDVFGELGLLNRTPRTATVTASTDGLVLAMERDDFLELVGAEGPLRGRLLSLYSGRPASR